MVPLSPESPLVLTLVRLATLPWQRAWLLLLLWLLSSCLPSFPPWSIDGCICNCQYQIGFSECCCCCTPLQKNHLREISARSALTLYVQVALLLKLIATRVILPLIWVLCTFRLICKGLTGESANERGATQSTEHRQSLQINHIYGRDWSQLGLSFSFFLCASLACFWLMLQQLLLWGGQQWSTQMPFTDQSLQINQVYAGLITGQFHALICMIDHWW